MCATVLVILIFIMIVLILKIIFWHTYLSHWWMAAKHTPRLSTHNMWVRIAPCLHEFVWIGRHTTHWSEDGSPAHIHNGWTSNCLQSRPQLFLFAELQIYRCPIHRCLFFFFDTFHLPVCHGATRLGWLYHPVTRNRKVDSVPVSSPFCSMLPAFLLWASFEVAFHRTRHS